MEEHVETLEDWVRKSHRRRCWDAQGFYTADAELRRSIVAERPKEAGHITQVLMQYVALSQLSLPLISI